MTIEYLEQHEEFTEQVQSYDYVKSATPNLSIVIPIYNGESCVRDCIVRIKNAMTHISEDYEILVVNDGSRDSTRTIVEELSHRDPRIRLLSYTPNMGKGYAIKQGVFYAEGENILFIDGDSDVKPSLISSYMEKLENADIIIGSKYHPDSKVQAPGLRKILSHGFQLLVRIALNVKVTDTQVGLKAGKARCFKKIFGKVLVKKYAFDAEMLAVGTLLGCKIVEMPVDIIVDKQFKIKDIMRMFIDIAGVAYRLRIINWYQQNLNSERPTYRPIIPL